MSLIVWSYFFKVFPSLDSTEATLETSRPLAVFAVVQLYGASDAVAVGSHFFVTLFYDSHHFVPFAFQNRSRGDAIDRPQAEATAVEYYAALPEGLSANDALDPRRIREWLGSRQIQREPAPGRRNFVFTVSLARSAQDYKEAQLTVYPVKPADVNGNLVWLDPAGYVVATCATPVDWVADTSSFSFVLHVSKNEIVGTPYLPHRR